MQLFYRTVPSFFLGNLALPYYQWRVFYKNCQCSLETQLSCRKIIPCSVEIECFHGKFKLLRTHWPGWELGTSALQFPVVPVNCSRHFSLLFSTVSEMVFCQGCGTKLIQNGKFCHSCGTESNGK